MAPMSNERTPARPRAVHVGIDLAWKSVNPTGMAVVDADGALFASGTVRSDDELHDWLAEHAPEPAVVAIDAPLVVTNDDGHRMAERLLGRAYARYGASAYPVSRAHPWFVPPRAAVLAERNGWDIDPGRRPGSGATSCIEVYPHPAMVGLFELPQRILYKKGRDRQAGFTGLLGLLDRIPELRLDDNARWQEIRAVVAAPGRGDLTRIEDEVDAVFCAHLAWRWAHLPESLHVYGDVTDGYIVAPPPPTHPAIVPKRRETAPLIEQGG